jgi:hypothetical protein
MSELSRIYEAYVNVILEDKSSECEEKFGTYLFGEFSSLYGSKKEVNTKYENEVFSEIKQFIRGEKSGKKIDNTLEKAFMDLYKCKQNYKQILSPSTNPILYRGIALTKEDFDKLKFSDKYVKQDYHESLNKFKYKGNSKIQSWTTNFNVADEFSMKNEKGNRKYPVIMEYKFNSNELLFNMDVLNKISEIFGFDKEDEIIRIEKSPIDVKVYANEDIF